MRKGSKALSTKDELKPKEQQRVIDLVRAAGIDVSDWAKIKGGKKRAAANPKYCYEWAFMRPGRVVALNLWFVHLREQDGIVTLEDNARRWRRGRSRSPQEGVWKKRAVRFDRAIREAVRNRLQIRAIINEGRMRKTGEQKASRVERRLLDPVPWAVASYDEKTGDFMLVRGAAAAHFADQFLVPPEPESKVDRRPVAGMTYVRNPVYRVRALQRAQGNCELCGQPGFTMPDGRTFLETHHVIPLSDGGPDVKDNVAAICPNHHREAHYGSRALEIRHKLQAHLRRQVSRPRS